MNRKPKKAEGKMKKLQETLENLRHTYNTILAEKVRNDAERKINENMLDQLEFEISRYQAQIKLMERKLSH
jgi:hypothetical protein